MSGFPGRGRSNLLPSAAPSSASLKSKIHQIQRKMSARGKRRNDADDACQTFRCSPPCRPGSNPTVRRILGACLLSLLTLLGSISIDLQACITEWGNIEAALGVFSSCTDVMMTINVIEFLQDQRTSCRRDHLNSTNWDRQFLDNVSLSCNKAQVLHDEDCRDVEEFTQICQNVAGRIMLEFEDLEVVGLSNRLSRIISEMLDEFLDLNEDLSTVKTNQHWVDVLSLHILVRAKENVLRMHAPELLSSSDLQPLEFQMLTTLHYALHTSDTLLECWVNNGNVSKFLMRHQQGDFLRPFLNVSIFDDLSLLVFGLSSVQKCFYHQATAKLSHKSRDILSTLTLKVTLLTVSCLIYPIVLVSFKQMTEWIQSYARDLKKRTRDLNKERRLAEDLLHQMLPKSVVRQLRQNKHVEAENYDQVTIFFSDVVGFTSISASCSPLQVVEMLNSLYVCFDTRIESYNVYKVETIGDAYMVVSGLPERSNHKHADEIAKMALDLVAAVRQVIIPHMPGERLQLRAGIHTGPVVAGVVGYKMPRYCLFGDTVNTASRMESTSLPQKIHISSAAYQALLPDNAYEIEPRGEIEVKGKGKMKTYWLLGNKNYSVQNDSLVCHWNPELSRRKKLESSLGSGLQSHLQVSPVSNLVAIFCITIKSVAFTLSSLIVLPGYVFPVIPVVHLNLLFQLFYSYSIVTFHLLALILCHLGATWSPSSASPSKALPSLYSSLIVLPGYVSPVIPQLFYCYISSSRLHLLCSQVSPLSNLVAIFCITIKSVTFTLLIS
ncbi:uncharacterized protein PAF06_016303 [Gastrophryne carolinensis]